MKRTLLLSFIMIAFIAGKSFAQTKKSKSKVIDEKTAAVAQPVSNPILNVGVSDKDFFDKGVEYSWSFEDIKQSSDKTILSKLKGSLEEYGVVIKNKLYQNEVLSFKINFAKSLTYSTLLAKLNEIGVMSVKRNENTSPTK